MDDSRKQRIKDLTKFQRVGVLQTIFDKLFRKKASRVENEDFRLKHGRGSEFNAKHMPNLDEDGPSMTLPVAEFTEASDPYLENRPQKSIAENGKMIKMFYSSNREESE